MGDMGEGSQDGYWRGGRSWAKATWKTVRERGWSENWRRFKAWVKEFLIVAGNPWRACLAVWGGFIGIVSAFLSVDFFEGIRPILGWFLIASTIGAAAGIVAIGGYAIWRLRQSESTQPVPFAHNALLHIVAGDDYVDNLERFRERHPGYRHVVCVCGLAREASLCFLTEGSVVRSLMEKIVRDTGDWDPDTLREMGRDEFAQLPAMRRLQGLVDAEKRRILDGRGKNPNDLLEYGDCILVNYDPRVFRGDNQKQQDPGEGFLVLFLINSSAAEDSSCDPNAIVGPESSSLMHCVFDRLKNQHIDLLFIPVLGTNRLDNNHQSVISSIIQRYCAQTPPSRRLYDLAISVRKTSMAWDGLSLVQVRQYIKASLKFFA